MLVTEHGLLTPVGVCSRKQRKTGQVPTPQRPHTDQLASRPSQRPLQECPARAHLALTPERLDVLPPSSRGGVGTRRPPACPWAEAQGSDFSAWSPSPQGPYLVYRSPQGHLLPGQPGARSSSPRATPPNVRTQKPRGLLSWLLPNQFSSLSTHGKL